MFALQECYGLVQVASHKERMKHKHKTLQAFAKLGGKRLGHVYLGEVSQTNLVPTIKDLQSQASLLLRHPKRTSNYMKLELDNTVLPSLTYRDDMTEEVKHQALRCLQSATHGSKVDLSWNEDDTEALRVLQDRFAIFRGRTSLKFHTVCPELGVLAYSDVAREVEAVIVVGANVDLSFVEYLQNLECLKVGCRYRATTIKTWHFARNLALKTLVLTNTKVEAPSFAVLKHLEVLYVRDTQMSPDMFKGCTKLTRTVLVNYTQVNADAFRTVMQTHHHCTEVDSC